MPVGGFADRPRLRMCAGFWRVIMSEADRGGGRPLVVVLKRSVHGQRSTAGQSVASRVFELSW
ncbi:hypothetical protein M440DRAFT_1399748 [Trichoderma longibrachiatum ATCC 18648]|uniref:Uncharacterized protein n=1 Tax=Trichoderma longibrachiatum ATCC 18648 TaxID=983965 RepID=A0A2T4CAM5_TRILO|nr:hypothetical protein M440DRAFT_1399748 [Trichoderma longibrachiatum ATCC 18648]